MQKTRKILRAISEKTVLPTYQPTNQPTNQPTKQPTNAKLEAFLGICPNQEFFSNIQLCDFSTFIVP